MRSALLLPVLLTACGGGVSNEADAEAAYLGLDGMLAKAVNLGFAGYNGASSANIEPQTTEGEVTGALTVDGQVDQGASDNKGMRLTLALDEYSDGEVELEDDTTYALTYYTEADALPELDVQLRDIPDGTLAGTLVGAFVMDGELEGDVVLSLDLIGEIEDDGAGGVQRTEGTVVVSGSATSPYGIYAVELEL